MLGCDITGRLQFKTVNVIGPESFTDVGLSAKTTNISGTMGGIQGSLGLRQEHFHNPRFHGHQQFTHDKLL